MPLTSAGLDIIGTIAVVTTCDILKWPAPQNRVRRFPNSLDLWEYVVFFVGFVWAMSKEIKKFVKESPTTR